MLFDAHIRSFAAMGGQANTAARLMVGTIFGLVDTITTGLLGMNRLAAADACRHRTNTPHLGVRPKTWTG